MRCLIASSLLAVLFLVGAPDHFATASDAGQLKGIEVPAKGFARLYVFRPGFSADLRHESPLVAIDETELFELAYKSYSSLVLQPGAYEITTRPNMNESEIWNGRTRVSLDADRVYFLAVWNDTTIGGGSLGVVTPYLGLLGVLIDNSEYSTGVRFELVTEKDAAPLLKDMTYVRARRAQGEAKP